MKVDTNSKFIQQKPQNTLEKFHRDAKKVAQGTEEGFAKFMLDQMKKSIGSSSPDSTGMRVYKDLLTAEQAKIMTSKDGGLGLQKVILDQIIPKHLRMKINQNIAKNNYHRQIPNKHTMHQQLDDVVKHNPQGSRQNLKTIKHQGAKL